MLGSCREGGHTVAMGEAPLSTGCALLVDDDPDTLSTLRELLLMAGVPVVKTATSLPDARRQLTLGPRPTTIVLDLLLQGQRGESLLEQMRADPRYSSTPVYVVSGDPGALQRVQAKVTGTFLKPADPGTLVPVLVQAAMRPA